MSDVTPETPPVNDPTPTPTPTSPSNNELLEAINSLPDRFAKAMQDAFKAATPDPTPDSTPDSTPPPAPDPEPDPTPKSVHPFFRKLW